MTTISSNHPSVASRIGRMQGDRNESGMRVALAFHNNTSEQMHRALDDSRAIEMAWLIYFWLGETPAAQFACEWANANRIIWADDSETVRQLRDIGVSEHEGEWYL